MEKDGVDKPVRLVWDEVFTPGRVLSAEAEVCREALRGMIMARVAKRGAVA